MRKLIAIFTSLALVSAPALAQVVPENCLPVFPLADDLAVVQQVPGDVIADRAVPVAESRRGIFGLPLLPFLLAGAGGLAALGLSGDGEAQPNSVA